MPKEEKRLHFSCIEGEAYLIRWRWKIFLHRYYYALILLTILTPFLLPPVYFGILFGVDLLIGSILLWLNDSSKLTKKELQKISKDYLEEFQNEQMDLIKILTHENKYLREAAAKILDDRPN